MSDYNESLVIINDEADREFLKKIKNTGTAAATLKNP